MKRRNKKSVLSIILSVALLTGGIGNHTQSSAYGAESNAKKTESLENARQLWMHFDNEDCKDYSGNQIVTQTVGNMSYETGHAGTGKALTLNSAGKDYVNLGKAVSLQSKQVTVSAWIKAPKGGFIGEQILLWCKPSAKWNEKGYYITLNADCGVYLNVGAGADGAGDGMVRAKVGNSGDSFFPAGEWVHLAVTFDSDSNDAAIYRNGEKQKINFAGIDKNQIEQDSENDKFLAASGYGNGFTGALDDVAVYSRVANQDEICELAGITKQSRVDADADKLDFDKNVSEDFSLPSSGGYGSSITWESNHQSIKIENNKAIVTRGGSDVTGKLTATISVDGFKQIKEIEVTVKGQTTDKVSAVDFTKVKVTDKFFAARQKQVICAILKVGIEKVEAANGGFNNFVEATKKNRGESAKAFEGDVYFLDSDAYKMIEAMSYGLQIDSNGDAEIEKAKKDITATLNKWIPYIEGAQEKDGYLDTFFTLDRGTQFMSAGTGEKNKWTDFAAHELYVDGHFYEAAVALYRSNGDTRLLDVAIKNADLINSLFGEGGSKKATSGHQEIELALLKLAAACQEAQANGAGGAYKGLYGEKSDGYVKLAKRFLDLRGDTADRDGYYSFGANNAKYRQDHEKVSKQTEAVGHVVRAMYQYIAMTDVTLLSDTYAYDNALTSLWRDITEGKMYVTGGMGIVNHDESFGASYQLPVNGAYSETCGSIGSVMWNQRMNMLYGDKKYVDVMETALYNAVLSGVNFDGNKFFYQNPISSDGSVERSAWFGCACCPPNLMRLINSLGGYLYTQDDNGININLYMGNEANIKVKDTNVKLTEETNMPWDGNIKMSVAPEKESAFALRFRVPDWCQGSYKVKINNNESDVTANDNGYLVLERTWKTGDTVEIAFDMNIIRTHQSDRVTDTKGYTAIKKGPVVYVAESADNNFNINLFMLPSEQILKETYTDNLTGGNDPYGIKGGLKITGIGKLQTIKGSKEQEITLIPYYAWNNRGKGIMKTYINESPDIKYGLEAFAKSQASYTSVWQNINSLNDRDDSTFWCSWIQGSVKENPWVQYEFDEDVVLSGCSVNWFADTADTRVPSGLTIQYRENSKWKNVSPLVEYKTFTPGVYNEYLFKAVKTKKIRMILNNTKIGSKTYALGINEWKLIEGTLDNTGNGDNTGSNNGNNKPAVTAKKKVTVAQVKDLKVKRKKKGVSISWKKVNKASGYCVYRSAFKKKSFKKIATVKKAAYIDKKAKKKTKYYYKVCAFKKSGKNTTYGKYSKTAAVKK